MEIRFNLKTGERVFKRIHLIIIILFLLLFTSIVLLNSVHQQSLILWGIGFLIFTGIRHFYLAGRKGNILQWLFPLLEGGILYIIFSIDSTPTTLSLFTLLIMDVVIDYEYAYGVFFVSIGYVTYMFNYIQYYAHLSLGSKILFFAIGAVQMILYTGFAFLAKRYSLQSHELQKTTSELHARMIALEQVAVLKERNRIAGEIHNTVGHQLTTALVQIEAVQMLMEKNPEEAKTRMNVIKDQIREGLQELRKSIHAINAEQEYENFDEAVNRLLHQVKAHAGVQPHCQMDDIREARLQLKKVLYHIILESVTNAIRHGHCKYLKVHLSKSNGLITLSSFNDGTVPKEIHDGYGLRQMKDTVKKMGGSLSLKINEDGWFGLIVKLPIHYQEGEANGED